MDIITRIQNIAKPRYPIETLLLKLGYRPEGRGICAGLFFNFLQAFLSGEMKENIGPTKFNFK